MMKSNLALNDKIKMQKLYCEIDHVIKAIFARTKVGERRHETRATLRPLLRGFVLFF